MARQQSDVIGRRARRGQRARIMGTDDVVTIERLKTVEGGAMFALCRLDDGEDMVEWTGRLLFAR